MGASVILNVLVGEGKMAALSQRLQQWGVPGAGGGSMREPPPADTAE
jgi:hypothetical protein